MATRKSAQRGIRRACIVIPTYNEAGNIVRHLDAVLAAVGKQKRVTFSILVVDDNSPDGTAWLVERYGKKQKQVHLLLRKEKEGLGKAYIAGMQHALDRLRPDVIYEMDADGQHDPKYLLPLLKTLQEGADFAIGSRYCEGGSIPRSWSRGQRFKSACAKIATNVLLGLRGISDLSGGYRAIRADLLRRIGLDRLQVRGYAFQAVLLEAAVHAGATVREIPIEFQDRDRGSSKMTMRDMIEPFGLFCRIRLQRLFGRRGVTA